MLIKPSSDKTVPIRMINSSEECVKIFENTVLGEAEIYGQEGGEEERSESLHLLSDNEAMQSRGDFCKLLKVIDNNNDLN